MTYKVLIFLVFISAGMVVKASQKETSKSPEHGSLRKRTITTQTVKVAVSTAHGGGQVGSGNAEIEYKQICDRFEFNKPMAKSMQRRVKIVHRNDDGIGMIQAICCFTIGCCCGCFWH